ncbi:MAG: di-trans,poly-cis-decaprenylcistransferase [Candidatus Liptonbacteria bacterium]|nr:di-trans,poly-cis-decaprenylcistransferase [Candidatus Liptonbacteria bacterium]
MTTESANVPRHILIIPDGNRRWAKKRNELPYLGHFAGAEAAKEIMKKALELRLPALTLWCASVENLEKRPALELKFLFKVFEEYFTNLSKEPTLAKYGVRIRIFGRLKLLPESVQKALHACVEATKNHSNHSLTFLLGYSGKDEMRSAIQEIVHNSPQNITEEIIKESLWTRELPPVDLVIRTGGEPHLSTGVMMWDIADAHFYFTETLWPEFSPEEFKRAIEQYAKAGKRRGA